MWRSLAAHRSGGPGVVGSIPAIPTISRGSFSGRAPVLQTGSAGFDSQAPPGSSEFASETHRGHPTGEVGGMYTNQSCERSPNGRGARLKPGSVKVRAPPVACVGRAALTLAHAHVGESFRSHHAHVAQLAEAAGRDSVQWRFESSHEHHGCVAQLAEALGSEPGQ